MNSMRRSPEGLEVVVREHHDRLVALLTLRVGSADVAQELAQDTLAELVAKWSSVDDPSAWLTRVALNRSASWWRRRYAERRAVRRHGPDDSVTYNPAVADAIALHEQIARLSEGQQRVVMCLWFEGMNVAETARLLGVREATVRSRTHRALKRLQENFRLEELADG